MGLFHKGLSGIELDLGWCTLSILTYVQAGVLEYIPFCLGWLPASFLME
jgi:hypothetical protein